MEQLGIERDDEPEGIVGSTSDGAMVFDTAPSLTFTKPTMAIVDGKKLPNPNWATILQAMIARIKSSGIEGEKLVSELAIPTKANIYEDDGYKYFTDLGISLQGQSATDAWREVNRLANKWRIPVKVEFVWRQTPKAQYPGKSGVLQAGNGNS